MSKGTRSNSKQWKITDLVRVLEERKTGLMKERIAPVVEARSSESGKEPVWEKEYDALILGDGPKGTYSMDPQVSQVNNNVLVIAGTGGGKTKSVVEANLLHAFHQSMVVLLTKRRLLDQYGPLLKSRGYDVRVLDLVHPERSDVGYDPMLHLRDESDIIGLAKALVFSSGCTSAKEPYWENSAADLFAAFVKLARRLYGDSARMEDVLERIQKIDYPPYKDDDDDDGVVYYPEDDDIDMNELRGLTPVSQFFALQHYEPQMFMSWYQFYKNADNTKACIRSMLVSAVNGVLTKGIQKIMAMKKQLEFTNLVNRKTVLFILTSPVNPALHPFANLVLGAMFKELFEYAESLPGGRVPIPLTAICDDFATGGQIPNFQQHISIFREKGIAAMMLVQSLAQLESMYGQAASVTIQDNTDNIIYMGGNNLDTAEQMARRINKPMDEVLALPRGQIYLFRSGQKGLQLQRYQIFNDPLYQQKLPRWMPQTQDNLHCTHCARVLPGYSVQTLTDYNRREDDTMIYFTSDLHFWHKNAILYTNRPFGTVEEMNEKLIEYWNSTVHKNDEVYLLGDVTMVKPNRAAEIIARLKGRKYLLMGNHDYFAREKQFDPAACGIEWVKMYHELHWQGRTFVLCHYPFVSWNKDSHGSYNLHGHSHNFAEYNLQNKATGRRQYDVGVDANGFRPVSIKSIVNLFEGNEVST